MPPIIPDAPWWANLILLFFGVVAVAGTAIFAAWIPHQRKTRARLDDIARDAKATRAQAENSHGTNLRDDIDLTRAMAEAAAGGVRRVETYLADLDRTIASLEKSLDRRDRLQTRAIEESIKERNALIEEATKTGRRETVAFIERAVADAIRFTPPTTTSEE